MLARGYILIFLDLENWANVLASLHILIAWYLALFQMPFCLLKRGQAVCTNLWQLKPPSTVANPMGGGGEGG